MDSNKENYKHAIYQHVDEKDADATAWAFLNPEKFTKLPFKFPEIGPKEIRANVLYAGLCLSDSLHGRSLWGQATYPLAPGHEVVAEVSQVGSEVKDFQVGEKVGFGTTRDCCGSCKYCKKGSEPCCSTLPPYEKFTYGKYWGGYATQIQQPADFFFKLPKNLDLAKAAPLFCAGITVYTPIKKYARKDDKCAVIGIGGLGHLAVQFLHKLGYHVTGVTTSDDKKDLIFGLGANEALNINNEEELKKHKSQYDFIINTVPAGGDLFKKFVSIAATQCYFVQVGVPEAGEEMKVLFSSIVSPELHIVGSLVGNRSDTNEMIELCAKENIYPIVEEFSFNDFALALDRLEHGKPKFRCVVNVQK